MGKDDFIRVVNPNDVDDKAYLRKNAVIAVSPRLHPQIGIVSGSTVVLEGGMMIQVATSVERMVELLGISQEPEPATEDAQLIQVVES